MGGRGFVVALAVLCVLGARAHAEDDGGVPQPKATPHGEPVTFRRSLGDAATLPIARISQRQTRKWADDRVVTLENEFVARAAPEEPDGDGRPRVRVGVVFASVANNGKDWAPDIRASGASVAVDSSFGPDGLIAEATTSGADSIADFRMTLQPIASWMLAPVPTKPVRAGETWDMPIGYFLWSIRQPGGAPAHGFVTQVLDAIEDHGGVRCAKIRTVVSLTRPQPRGMTPAWLEIGDGAAVGRFRGSGTSWVDLTGSVREETFDVTLRTENTETHKAFEWSMHRELRARPAPLGLPPSNWTAHEGKVPFVVGYEKGMETAWTAGKPAMLFLTSAHSGPSRAFGARSFVDPQVLAATTAYLPVLVDADEFDEAARRYGATTLPAVFWVDVDDQVLVKCVGNAPIDDFRSLCATAREEAAALKPSQKRVTAMILRDTLRDALKRGDVHTAFRSAQDLEEAAPPLFVLSEARAAKERLEKDGRKALEKAKTLASSGKTAEAKAMLEELLADYGENPIGEDVARLLQEFVDTKK